MPVARDVAVPLSEVELRASRRRPELHAVFGGEVRDALSALCDYVVTRTS